MFRTKPILAASVMVWLTGTSVFALTADQVWQDWQAHAKGVGLLLTADPATTAGGELSLRNLQLSAENQVILRLFDMTLTETAEGAVTVGLPATFDLSPPPRENPDPCNERGPERSCHHRL